MTDTATEHAHLKPANENPWYVLMTLCDDAKLIGNAVIANDEESLKRRMDSAKYWNAWVTQNLSQPEREWLGGVEKDRPIDTDWASCENQVRELFAKRWHALNGPKVPVPDLPSATADISLDSVLFDGAFDFSMLIITQKLNLMNSVVKGHFACKNAFFFQTVDASYAQVEGTLNLDGATFNTTSLFSNVRVGEYLIGHKATFSGRTGFSLLKCMSHAFFDIATFNGRVSFAGSTFAKAFDFKNVTVHRSCSFDRCRFERGVDFTATKFANRVSFRNVIFSAFANFRDVCFGWENSEAKSYAVFDLSEFKKPLSFYGATFYDHNPSLAGVMLHERASFSTDPKGWPALRNQPSIAKSNKNSLAVIRHAVAKQGLPEDEHFFFRREMFYAGQIGNFWQRLPYRFYSGISDYGNSIWWPIIWLLVVWTISTLAFTAIFNWTNTFPPTDPSFTPYTWYEPAALSFANIFKFLGFQGTYLGRDFMLGLGPVTKMLCGFETIAGIVCLFFFGLGLRQRFRLR